MLPLDPSHRHPASDSNPKDIGCRSSPLPRIVQIFFVALVILAVVISVGFSLTEHWRRATFTLGAAFMWISVVRLSCDPQHIGVLSVRSRIWDCVFTSALGAVMIFLALSIDALGSG